MALHVLMKRVEIIWHSRCNHANSNNKLRYIYSWQCTARIQLWNQANKTRIHINTKQQHGVTSKKGGTCANWGEDIWLKLKDPKMHAAFCWTVTNDILWKWFSIKSQLQSMLHPALLDICFFSLCKLMQLRVKRFASLCRVSQGINHSVDCC